MPKRHYDHPDQRDTAAVPDRTTTWAASYGRTAHVDPDDLRSQHEANARRAAADGFSIPDDPAYRFGDDGVSGMAETRAQLESLMSVVTSGSALFRRLYMRDRTRWGRSTDPRFIYWFEYVMAEHGVQVCYTTDAEHSSLERSMSSAVIGGVDGPLPVPTLLWSWAERVAYLRGEAKIQALPEVRR